MKRADFAVVGAGPSGASAARRLAQAGARVLVLERRPMPRAKPCGGGLSERALGFLDAPLPPDLVDGEVFGARAHLGSSTIDIRHTRRVGVYVTRATFDQWLLSMAEEAGARVAWADVHAARVTGDGVSLDTSAGAWRAACTIICEGAGGRLARLVRRPDARDEQGFCLAADVPATSPDRFGDLDGLMDLHLGAVARGYGWVFHHGAYYSVGVGGLWADFDRPLEAFRRFAADRGLALDGVRVRGHLLPCGGIRRTLCADRLLLAGDAGGWADPLQGEGLPYAIRSGQLAADAALAAGERRDFSARGLAGYEARCREVFGRDLEAALTLSRLIHRGRHTYARSLPEAEAILRQYLRVGTMELSYREFLRWMLVRAPWFWLRARLARRAGPVEGPAPRDPRG